MRRLLGFLLVTLFCVAPIAALAQAGETAVISGVASDGVGAPIEGAAVKLQGPTTLTTATDAKGAFSFPAVPPADYIRSVTKPGYNSAIEPDVLAFAGEHQDLVVRMDRASFTSLRTIATVRTKGAGQINTSQASVDVVTSQEFLNQSQPQVTRVLSQVPGLQISFPSNSANAAAPGSITIPNIRGATSYETASLIDGHPISVGQYGDNVTTFLNTFMFDNIEVIKGPGADSPVVNNAIGGTTNFHTKDPTLTATPDIVAGFDSHGGSFSNFGFSDTLGKLGFVVDVAALDEPSALNGKGVYFDPSNGYYQGSQLFSNSSANQLVPTGSFLYNQTSLLACCYTLYGNLDQLAELVKFHYKFSSATTATVSYLGSQSESDQSGNTSAYVLTQFNPQTFDPTYGGSLKPGTLPVANVFAGAASSEYNNEPIFQGEVSTTLGNDALIGRFYHATINRFQFQGTSATVPDYDNVTLYGVNSGGPTFNGTSAGVGYYDFYQEPELDQLTGWSFEYQHPIGDNLLSFAVDTENAKSSDYTYNAQPPGGSSPIVSNNLFPGTSQVLTTYLVRGHFLLGKKLDATLSDYINTYSSTFATNCPTDAFGNCTASSVTTGAGVTFQTTNKAHNDPRIGFVYRPTVNSAVRFAMGSSIAPVYSGLLNVITSAPSYDSAAGVALESTSNGNIVPETGFGYDLGADLRLKDQTVISGDLYLTDLYNRFFNQTIATGLTCGAATPCSGGAPPGTPILNQTSTNISNARFEGVEFSIKRAPAVGLGYNLSGSLLRGYYYDLPANFYCSVPGTGCTPNQNLNIVAGQNTNGISVGNYPLNAEISYNGNMRIPYGQAYTEVSYTFANKAYTSIGMTFFGHNNSLNEPAFGIGNATIRYPLNDHVSLQISGDNIFNAYPGILPTYGGGVPIQLAANAPCPSGATCVPSNIAATNGNVLGPATWRFSINAKLP